MVYPYDGILLSTKLELRRLGARGAGRLETSLNNTGLSSSWFTVKGQQDERDSVDRPHCSAGEHVEGLVDPQGGTANITLGDARFSKGSKV